VSHPLQSRSWGSPASLAAMLAAIDGFDELGHDEFLSRYGFKWARKYVHLSGAELTGANLLRAYLSAADLRDGARLSGAGSSALDLRRPCAL
jgi:hypothetical protein